MPVELNQWRATIGCFNASIPRLCPLSKNVWPLSILLQVTKLYWSCFCFIVIATLVLPAVLITQFLAVHCFVNRICFLSLLARVHHFTKTVFYVSVELSKRIPRGFVIHVRYKYIHSQYAYFYTACIACYIIQIQWLLLKTVLLSGDVETNPGPDTLDFCSWNLNSITSYNFLRVSLIEAYNSVYIYDMIGIKETHLDSTVDNDRLSLDGYSFMRNDHPQNVKRGGVGLYIKETLPSKERSDLVTLPECIVCEIQLNRRKYFFVVVYRSPSQDQGQFDNFMINFEMMLSKMHAENPYCVIITGDFNCRSTQWWESDIENNEGKLFEPLTADIGLHQLISEPTHLMGSSKSCIDLLFTDQPNLITDSGVHPSLHEQCHHQIVYGKLSVSNITLPPYTRKIWFYDKADFVKIVKSIETFRWQEHLQKIACPNEQVKLLNEVLLNIYSNFIPNQVKTIKPRQAPWITKTVKNCLKKKSRAYKSFVKNGRPDDKLEGIQNKTSEATRLIEDAKRNYFRKAGKTLANPGTCSKTYWTLINTVLNKAKIPIIPPLLENGLFVTDFTEKAQIFNDYFILQCTTIDTGSEIPHDAPVPTSQISEFLISDDKILNIIRSLNPNKAHGWDEISVRIIKLSDAALVTPLKIIFTNCLKRGVFPEVWKCANVVPVHKKKREKSKEKLPSDLSFANIWKNSRKTHTRFPIFTPCFT